MEKDLSGLVAGLKEAHKENLASVVLYGSAVTGDHVRDRSNYNVLVVLNRITPDDLQAAHPVVEKWQKSGHPLPLYFTREEMADASDVFPIEFLDMSSAHRVLYGYDPLAGLEIPTYNLRRQLEYELRGKLIRLRELYIPASHSAERLSALMADSIVSFAALFRHVVHLLGVHEVGQRKREIIEALKEATSIDTAPFMTALDVREKKQRLSQEEANRLFASYLASVEEVIQIVDQLEVKG